MGRLIEFASKRANVVDLSVTTIIIVDGGTDANGVFITLVDGFAAAKGSFHGVETGVVVDGVRAGVLGIVHGD